jgi:hypothetical protein
MLTEYGDLGASNWKDRERKRKQITTKTLLAILS